MSDRGRRVRWSRGLGMWALVTAVLLCSSLTAAGAPGCDRWTGARSQSWATAANWSAGVPSANTIVCIPGRANAPTVGGHAFAGTVSLGGKGQLTIAASGVLSVSHSARVAGTLALASSTSSLSAPTLRVTRTGTLSGVGALKGNLDNFGNVDVIDGASGIPLRISGRYRQGRSGTLLFRYEGGGFTQLRATTVSVDGTLDMLILDALTPGTRYRLLSSSGTLTGRFAHVVPGYVLQYRRHSATAVVTSQIQLSSLSVAPETNVTVSGASFGYEGSVAFHLDTATGPVLGSSNITSVGTFQGTAKIPKNVSPGYHVIVAVESPHGYRARAGFTVP